MLFVVGIGGQGNREKILPDINDKRQRKKKKEICLRKICAIKLIYRYEKLGQPG